jgi:hypothetical protein
VRSLQQFSLAVEDHVPLHELRARRHIRERNNFAAMDWNRQFSRDGRRGFPVIGVLGQLRGHRMPTRQRGVAEAISQPVLIRVLMLLRPDVIEGRDGERVDGRRRKERIAAHLYRDDAHPAFAAARSEAVKMLTSPVPLLRVKRRKR